METDPSEAKSTDAAAAAVVVTSDPGTPWWARVRYVYSAEGDPTHADSVARARERPSPSQPEYDLRLATLRAQLRRIWRGERVEEGILVELGIRRLAAEATVAIERGANADGYGAAFALLEEMLLGHVAAWLKQPAVAENSTKLLLGFLGERYGDDAPALVAAAVEALLSFGDPGESRTPTEAISETLVARGARVQVLDGAAENAPEPPQPEAPPASTSPLRIYHAERETGLLAEARATAILSSSVGRGRAREHFVSRFLTEHLPTRLVASRGEVIDSFGRRSGEVDCVLVDHESQAYRMGGEVLVPIEAATGVLEVKSSLAGDELEGAIRKIARVKLLIRTPHTGMHRSADTTPRVPVPPRTTQGYIVAYDAPSWKTIMERLQAHPEWYGNDWWAFGPELICTLGRGLAYKNDRHYWIPRDADLADSGMVVEDRPCTQMLMEHIQTTLTRYGALTYELARYNA